MDMPETYYWIGSVWILWQMLQELYKWLKRKRPKSKRAKRKRRKNKRRK